MTIDTKKLAALADARLRAAGDPKKAAPMAAYMKTSDPFFGVPRPARVAIEKEIAERFRPENRRDFERAILALWKGKERERRYLALAYASRFEKLATFDTLRFYERLIREGQWWDTVDWIAGSLVSRLYLRERKRVEPVLKKWIDDENMWVRRSAILAHLAHKTETNEPLLYAFCLKRAHEKEFFIRKAIGWALRQHSKTSPKSVVRFLKANDKTLSPLSVREGRKVILRTKAKRRATSSA